MLPVLVLWLAACTGAPPTPSPNASPEGEPVPAAAEPGPEAAEPAVATAHADLDAVETCAACHQQVVTEWKQSMHSRAHHDADPVYGAMRAFRMEKQGEAVGRKCNTCHTPRAPDDEDGAAARAGVSCAACHTTVDVRDGAQGAEALVAGAPGTVYGPHAIEDGASPIHGNGGVSAVIADGRTLCLACHAATKNPAGVATCTTGPEHGAVEGAEPCTGCHMPRVDGPSGSVSSRADHASHVFAGPHRAWYQDDPAFLAQALEVEARFDGGALVVDVANAAQHGFPTGFPGRVAMLRVQAKDAAGAVVWSNLGDDPMTDDPEVVWNKIYVDAEGQPTMPPFAEALKADRRLAAGARVSRRYAVPAEAVSAEIALVFRLLPPPAAQTLGIADLPEAAPRVAPLAAVTR